MIVVIAIIVRKKHKKHNNTISTYLNRNTSMIGNAAYNSATFENIDSRYSEVVTYDYPHTYLQVLSSTDEGVKAKPTTFQTRLSTMYIMSITSQRNEAYGVSCTETFEDSYVKYY